MENLDASEDKSKVSDSDSNSCSNSQSRRSIQSMMDNLDSSENKSKISDSGYLNTDGGSIQSMMDNLDRSENNANVSDSVYSNSYNNCQTRRSIQSMMKNLDSSENKLKVSNSGYLNTDGGSLQSMMDNLDRSENNAKVSDSGYSNSCSNSQSRSHSSKSTHSGSHSSGSSGYGGNPSSSSNITSEAQEKSNRSKDKDIKMKSPQTELFSSIAEEAVVINTGQEQKVEEQIEKYEEDLAMTIPSIPSDTHAEVESMDISTCGSTQPFEEVVSLNHETGSSSCKSVMIPTLHSDGFTSVISLHDGIVVYTTSYVNQTLGYPEDMWVGRSFIDFLHPKDRSTFASQITNSLAVPKTMFGHKKDYIRETYKSKMFCRIRKHRGLKSSFSVKDKDVKHIPFLLMLSFKNINEDEGKTIYLVIQAVAFHSGFQVPNEVLDKPVRFTLHHSASGSMVYIDPESVPYLGFLPQDLADKDALQMYHPGDLDYIEKVYEELVKKGTVENKQIYRLLCNNGDYIKLTTEWSASINPWSRKLEYVIGKHTIVEGPQNPDVFDLTERGLSPEITEADKLNVKFRRENIFRIMNEVLTKTAELARQNMNQRCQMLMTFMKNIVEPPKKKIIQTEDPLSIDIFDPDKNDCEKDVEMLGIISPHHMHSDSKSTSSSPISYTQLNYNETLQRYFDSYKTIIKNAGIEEFAIYSDQETRPQEISNLSMGLVIKLASSTSTEGVETKSNSTAEKKLTHGHLAKHNAEIEREMAKKIREQRAIVKSDRQKVFNEQKQRKKEHIARCNASYIPTMVEMNSGKHAHGLKRLSVYNTEGTVNKYSISTHKRKKQRGNATTLQCAPIAAPIAASIAAPMAAPIAAPMAAPMATPMAAPMAGPTPTTFAPNLRTDLMPIVSPVVTAVPAGVVPMYYVPATATATVDADLGQNNTEQNQQPVQNMMYLQAVVGSSFLYSPVTTQQQFTVQPNIFLDTACLAPTRVLGLTNSNYVEACKHHNPPVTKVRKGSRKQIKLSELQVPTSQADVASGESSSDRSARPQETTTGSNDGSNSTNKIQDNPSGGESSYSSFYSSFFKTEFGSTEESDAKSKNKTKWRNPHGQQQNKNSHTKEQKKVKSADQSSKIPKKKMEPPWMDQVRATPELIYRYQINTKTIEEILKEDKLKMEKMEQPSMVNDQMNQLFLDLQLEGDATTLTIDGGVTSSSSGEENIGTSKKVRSKDYNKMALLFEENAPLPPSTDTNAVAEDDEPADQPMESGQYN